MGAWSSSLDGQVFTVDTGRGRYRLRVPLLGEHQMENAAVAVGIIEALVDGGMEIDAGSIEEGFQSVDWPCRLEVLRRNPLLMADGAHNPSLRSAPGGSGQVACSRTAGSCW